MLPTTASASKVMFPGHFATGLFLHAAFPSVDTWIIFFGSVLLDLIDGVNIVLGLSKVSPDPDAGPYLPMRLDFIDWDHSVAMATVWSLAFALVYGRASITHFIVAAASVMSHWLDDWPVHNEDLALYPHSKEHFGYSLWTKLSPYQSWAFEVVFTFVFCVAAARLNRRRGIVSYGPYALIAILAFSTMPDIAITRLVLRMPEHVARFVGGPFLVVGMAVPAHLLARMTQRAQRDALKRQGKRRA